MSIVRQAALRFGVHNRRRKLAYALWHIRQIGAESVLLVGVHAGHDGVNNLIERGLASSAPRVVGIGLDEFGPSWLHYRKADALDLPFCDGEFDFVFSNAVIEHVTDQVRFVAEHDRVGRSWMLTTPNRLFPVEAHDHTLFTHWRAGWVSRSGSVTRLLSPGDLRGMLPPDAKVHGRLWPTLVATGGSVSR